MRGKASELRVGMTGYTSMPSDADGYAERSDLLPSLKEFGQRLEEIAIKNPSVFVPSDNCSWLELERVSRNIVRAIKSTLMSEIQGSWRRNRFRRLRCWWQKESLIRTLQATEHVLQTSYVSHHIHDVINAHSGAVSSQYRGDLRDLDLDFDIDQVSNSTIVKLLHLLCLLVFVRMPHRHIAGMSSLNENAVRFARLLTRPPTQSMLYLQSVSFDAALDASPRPEEPDEAQKGLPIHPDWLGNETSLAKITKLYVEQMEIKHLDDVKRASPEWMRALADDDTLGQFRDLLSSIVGAMKKDLDIAHTLQNKILGGMATLIIALLNFVFHHYMQGYMERRIDDYMEIGTES